MNIDFKTLEFHRGTQHPNGALFDYRHRFHLGLRPVLHKVYKGRSSVPLSIDRAESGRPALEAIGGFSDTGKAPDFGALSRLLHYSAGITKTIRGYPFRAAACTGALYHIELYVVCRTLGELDAGVYHYDPIHSRLDRLREGDLRAQLTEAGGGNATLMRSPAIILYTDVYGRNAVKYQARAYRHSFWDAGTIIANTLAMARSMDLKAQLHMSFADGLFAQLLGIDPSEELPLAMVSFEVEGEWSDETDRAIEPVRFDWEPKTTGYRDFPVIPQVHEASALPDVGTVRAWREEIAGEPGKPGEAAEWAVKTGRAEQADLADQADKAADVLLRMPPAAESPAVSLARVIARRGSSRAFNGESITLDQLAALLDRSIRPIRTDYQRQAAIIQPYLIVHAVEGLASGIYRIVADEDGRAHGLRKVRLGEFRAQAAHLALDQEHGGDAAVNIYFMANLQNLLKIYGERGYRLAQLEAAIMAGWGYLAAYALGIGATGLTFYDEAVEQFLGVTNEGLKVMFLLAVGVPSKRPG